MHPRPPPLTISGTVLKESDDLVILGVTFDSKMTFEKHLHSVSRAASQRLGIFRKSWRMFPDRSLLGRCFRGFVLPVLEYCSAVWCSAGDTHLKLLDGAISFARFLTWVTLLIVDLWQFCVCCMRSGIVYGLLYLIYSLLLFSLSLSVYRLVFWSWGLRTDRVYITSLPCTADLF